MLLEHLLASRSSAPPLRVALLVPGTTLARPDALVVDHLLRSDFARIELLIQDGRRVSPPPGGDSSSELPGAAPDDGRPGRLHRLYERWDRSRERASAELLGGVELAPRLAGIPRLEVVPIVERRTERLPPAALSRLRELAIDVVIQLAFGPLSGEVLQIPRYGVWSILQGDPEQFRGGSVHFWSLAERNPLSGVALRVAGGRAGDDELLCKGLVSTATEHDGGGYSHVRNSVQPRFLGSTFVIRKLRDLHEQGFESLRAHALPKAEYRGKRELYRTPTGWDTARFLVPRLARAARQRLFEPVKLNHWRVAFRIGGRAAFEGGRLLEREGFRWLEAPLGRFYADPFLIEHEGRVYCFFEDFDHGTRRGRIDCAVVGANGELEEVHPVLEPPYHLSYPFVFEDGGEHFLIPESSENRTVDLYRAVEFPLRWEKVRTLFEGRCTDTTVLRQDGRYWFFVTVREPEEAGEQLLLFSSASLDAAPEFHPANPISADVRYCRSAGAIAVRDGRLIRPSQDCSVSYGYQMHFHEITRLTPEDYAEKLIGTFAPWGDLDGTHTYNRCGSVEVIDGKWVEPARVCAPETVGRRSGQADGESARAPLPGCLRPKRS